MEFIDCHNMLQLWHYLCFWMTFTLLYIKILEYSSTYCHSYNLDNTSTNKNSLIAFIELYQSIGLNAT